MSSGPPPAGPSSASCANATWSRRPRPRANASGPASRTAYRATKAPFPRRRRVAERAVAAARDLGLLLYSSTGCADGTEGDLVMLGPPLVVTDSEVDELVELTARSVEAATVP
jgi:hypothetical protein